MVTEQFFSTLDTLLDIHRHDTIDVALNGLQVACERAEITRVVTAVDASIESIQRAASQEAGCLFVHHGIFWGGSSSQRPITGNLYTRIKMLIAADCALYAAHLPLDIHPELGNNIVIAKQFQLTDIQPFGVYRGTAIGYCGTLTQAQSLAEIEHTLLRAESAEPLGVLPFGPERCQRIAIVSGGGNFALAEAIERNIDLLITGDIQYSSYYEAQENAINLLFAGHYNSETGGVRHIAQYIDKELGVPATFIDLPTGL